MKNLAHLLVVSAVMFGCSENFKVVLLSPPGVDAEVWEDCDKQLNNLIEDTQSKYPNFVKRYEELTDHERGCIRHRMMYKCVVSDFNKKLDEIGDIDNYEHTQTVFAKFRFQDAMKLRERNTCALIDEDKPAFNMVWGNMSLTGSRIWKASAEEECIPCLPKTGTGF